MTAGKATAARTGGAPKNEVKLPFYTTVRGRLVITMLVLSLLPLLVIDLIGYYQSSKELERSADRLLVTVRDARASSVESLFQRLLQSIATIGDDHKVIDGVIALSARMKQAGPERVGTAFRGKPELVESMSAGFYSTMHSQYHEAFSDWRRELNLADIMLVDTEGWVVQSAAKGQVFATNLLSGPYAADGIARLFGAAVERTDGGVEISDFAPYSAADGALYAFIGRAIASEGKVFGVLVFQVKLADVDTLVLDQAGLGQTGQVYIVGADGLMRTNSRFSPEAALKQAADMASVKAAIEGRTGSGHDTDYFGKEVLAAYRPVDVPGVKWALVAQMAPSEARLSITSLATTLGLTGVLVALVVILTAIVIGAGLVRPVQVVWRATHEMATGDLSSRADVRSDDEIGLLAQGFNTMAEGLGHIVRRIVDSAAKLASSATEINATANQMSAGAESQAEQVIRTSTSMEEMSAAIQEVARNARSTAEATSVAVTRARDGSGRIQATLSDLDETNQALQRLKDRSAEIDRLVALIGDIAAQTNLLALNAAIEAAGAGAAGARFDVVAEEIRKLAQRSAASSDEIAATVAEVRRETERAAERMASTSAQAQAAGASLDDIVSGIASVDGMVAAITTSTDQQARAAEQVAEALQWITQVTQQTVQAARETAHTTDDLALLAQDMRSAVQQFKL